MNADKSLALFQVFLVLGMIFWVGMVSAGAGDEEEEDSGGGVDAGTLLSVGTTLYTIIPGDTLSGIAGKRGTSVDKLLELNPYITDKNTIYAGNKLNIPNSGASSTILTENEVPTKVQPPTNTNIPAESGEVADSFKVGEIDDGETLEPIMSGDPTDEYSDVNLKLGDSTGELSKGSTMLSGWVSDLTGTSIDVGSGYDALLGGVQYAVVAAGVGYLVGSMLGLSDTNTIALTTALGVGTGVYGLLSNYNFANAGSTFAEGGAFHFLSTGTGQFLTSAGIGIAIFAFMYKDTETKTVTFSCLPWQAPSGGENCELCNDDDLTCSQYRCRSLGAGCELVNEGTEEELCVYVAPRDVTPPIVTPNNTFLTNEYEYANVVTSPPGPGFEIVSSSGDGCLAAFTPLTFGVTLNEPGQCKIDYNSTNSYDDMVAYMGGNNMYSYTHSEVLSLPNTEDLEGAGFVLKNGNEMELYIRCQDKSGNSNEAEYAVRFCVDDAPDTTAPKIEATSIASGSCIAEGVDNTNVIFYVNEPAECRWDFQDRTWDSMENSMTCSGSAQNVNALQLYACNADIAAIGKAETNYYVRCKDQPGTAAEGDRNVNSESFKLSLRGSNDLLIRNISPNGTIYSGSAFIPVELRVETYSGCDDGKSVCYYSDDGSNYIMFYDTDSEDGVNIQNLNLGDGSYTYYVKCVDGGGNIAINSTSFVIDVDTQPPIIARAYEEKSMLKVVTVRDSTCAYSLDSCNFAFEDGTEMPYANSTRHVADWTEGETYYIRCRDEYLNEASGCSIVVRPSADFL
jgi:hypothetical protein